jgi:signal-transduction protein with cAMP-binding, CBS, and nucleotidyltransferase domain
MFKDMIQNWEALPNQSPGIIDSLISMLKLEIYPQNEYIITAGEIGSEMYFIVKGVVEIRSVN